MRDRLPVREAQVAARAVNTVSTNGRVEPEINYQFFSPIATTVKAVYVQPGDQVPAGKLLLVLDDVEARARLATAESGVKAAQAALGCGHPQRDPGTAPGGGSRHCARPAGPRSGPATIWMRSSSSIDGGGFGQRSGRGAAAAGHSRSQPARIRAERTAAAIRRQRWQRAQAALADAEANLAAARQVMAQTTIHAPVAGTVYSLNARPTEFVEQGKLLLQLADLHHERVRAYFDEPEIGRLAVGQPIQIKWDAKPGQQWHGHIVRTPVTVITYGTRNVGEVMVKIDDAGWRAAAGYQRHGHRDHLQRAECAECSSRSAALRERQALRL